MKLLKGPRAITKTGGLWRNANATRLATYLLALWKLFRHPQTPRAAKWLAIVVVAYAVSPIDLIPDFVPVLGLLDDVVLIPLGIALVVRMTPAPLWEERLREAEASTEKLPRLWWAAALIALVWLALIGLFVWWLVRLATA
jgi:uncharacterized membrane protein YkvA (DUF1232 family)